MQPAQPKTAAELEVEKAIEKSLATLAEGFRTRDAAMQCSPDVYFTDDSSEDHYVLFDVMPPSVDVGASNLLVKNQKFVDATVGPTEIYWTDKFIRSSGDLAFFRGLMHAKAKYKDGRTLEGAVRHTLVFKKIGGKYLIIHEHSSLPNQAVDMEGAHS